MNQIRPTGIPAVRGARARSLAPFGATSLAELFDSFFAGPLAETPRATDFVPSLEWTDRGADYLLRAELPGLDHEHVTLQIDDDVLVLRGEKRSEERREEDKVLMTERTFGSFERRLRLPGPIDVERVGATMKNGVLEVVLPKAAAKDGVRTIEIGR